MTSSGAAAAVAFVVAMAQRAHANSMSAKYAMTFEDSWSMAAHPLVFPVQSSAREDAVPPSTNPG